jgi:hypothetical protein
LFLTIRSLCHPATGPAAPAGAIPAEVSALTEGVLKMMATTNRKTFAAALALVGAVGMSVLAAYAADKPAPAAPAETPLVKGAAQQQAAPIALKAGVGYTFLAGGERISQQPLVVLEPPVNGWVKVSHEGEEGWINLNQVTAVFPASDPKKRDR